MTFRGTVLPAAKEDLLHILAWIRERSPQGADTWFRRWKEALQSLRTTATARGLAPESSRHTVEIRQLLFKTRYGRKYRALFTIQGDEVFVLRIRGPGQDLVPVDDLELPDDA